MCFFAFLLAPGLAEARDLAEVLESGKLLVGVRETPVVYDPGGSDGSGGSVEAGGFCFDLAVSFAASLGVEAIPVVVERFSEYWAKEAGQDGPSSTPAIYSRIDVAAEIFTVTDKRQAMVHLTPFVENRELFFFRIGEEARSYADLKGKRVLVHKGMSAHDSLVASLRGLGLPFREVEVVFDINADRVKPLEIEAGPDEVLVLVARFPWGYPALVSHQIVYQGEADAGIHDSFSLFYYLARVAGLRRYIRPGFAVDSDTGHLAFAVAPRDEALADALDAYMKKIKTNGQFAAIFHRNMNIDYAQYRKYMVDTGGG